MQMEVQGGRQLFDGLRLAQNTSVLFAGDVVVGVALARALLQVEGPL